MGRRKVMEERGEEKRKGKKNRTKEQAEGREEI